LDGGVITQGLENFEREYNVEGYFSRLTYSYNNKYFFNGSYRLDGSSVFQPDNRWGSFWGLGAAWNVANENFMQGLADWLNVCKLKASFGQQGNDWVYYPETTTRNYYAYRDQFAVVNNDDNLGINMSYLGNKDLEWEKSSNFNVGFETFWFNRFGLNFDYFQRNMTDLLYNAPLAPSLGVGGSKPENIGDMVNKGFELELNMEVIRTADLQWDININATHVRNEITALPKEEIPDGRFQLEVGRSRYDYYLKKFAGVDPENGDALWYKDEIQTDEFGDPVLDENGDPVKTGNMVTTSDYSDSADYYYVGKSAIPDLYGGFSTNIRYKGFDFGVAFSYQLGGYGYDRVYWGLFDATEIGQNFTTEAAEDTWTPENTSASLPRLDVGKDDQYYSSDLYLIKASYLSLKNITIGYTFNLKNKPAGLQEVRVYGVADNVWLWSKRKGFDPRLSVTGLSTNEYSVLRTISLGVKLKF
ncbi:MAG: TonB-dependent receptor, partial [Bacteroidales bacterium]|nr:TonB-dependent receptor [Bacteroidales bacterium]